MITELSDHVSQQWEVGGAVTYEVYMYYMLISCLLGKRQHFSFNVLLFMSENCQL